jgi:hypothetical protein
VSQIRGAGCAEAPFCLAQKPSHGAYPQKLWISLWIMAEQIDFYLPSNLENSVWLIFHRRIMIKKQRFVIKNRRSQAACVNWPSRP